MLSIRPFQGVIKERQAGYFLFWGTGWHSCFLLCLGHQGWCHLESLSETQYFELNIWDKGLRQGQSSWSQGSEQTFALHPPPATLPWVSFLSPTVSYHCPSPTSSAPVYTILKGSTQQTGSLHNCYLNT